MSAHARKVQDLLRANVGFDVWTRQEDRFIAAGPSGYDASEEQADLIGELLHRYGYTTIARAKKTLLLEAPR